MKRELLYFCVTAPEGATHFHPVTWRWLELKNGIWYAHEDGEWVLWTASPNIPKGNVYGLESLSQIMKSEIYGKHEKLSSKRQEIDDEMSKVIDR